MNVWPIGLDDASEERQVTGNVESVNELFMKCSIPLVALGTVGREEIPEFIIRTRSLILPLLGIDSHSSSPETWRTSHR